MKRDKALEVKKIMERIEKCEEFLRYLDGDWYDFKIEYKGYAAFDLEEDALNLLKSHYKEELDSLNKKLENL